MDRQEKSPGALAGALLGSCDGNRTSESTTSKRPRKWVRVLRALLAGRSFNRFEAERELHDHCLHSTIATLEARGVRILRNDEFVLGFAGASTRVKRYKIDPEAKVTAIELLANIEQAA